MRVLWRAVVGVWGRDEDRKVLVERRRNSLVERRGGRLGERRCDSLVKRRCVSKRYQNLGEGREDI